MESPWLRNKHYMANSTAKKTEYIKAQWHSELSVTDSKWTHKGLTHFLSQTVEVTHFRSFPSLGIIFKKKSYLPKASLSYDFKKVEVSGLCTILKNTVIKAKIKAYGSLISTSWIFCIQIMTYCKYNISHYTKAINYLK